MSKIMPIRVRNGKPARDPGGKNLPLPPRRRVSLSGRPARLRRAARYRAAPAGAARDSNGPTTDKTSDKTSRPGQALIIRYTVGTKVYRLHVV